MPEDTDRAAASREQAKVALTTTVAVDATLTSGQRRQVATERRRQAAEQTEMDPQIRSLILKLAADPDGTSTRRIEEALEREIGQERGLSRNGAWRYLDKLRFEGVVELRGKGRGQSWHLAAPEPEDDLERLMEEAEEQAVDDAIDNPDGYEE